MNNTIDVQVCGNQGLFPCTYKTVVLKPNIINDKNILNQGMMNMPNTKYVIKYDFLLSEAIVEKTVNVVSTNVSQCGNAAYAEALAAYNLAHDAWIEADNAYTNNPNDTTLAAKNAAYNALQAAQLTLNGTPQYYYFAGTAINLKKNQHITIPEGCVLLNSTLNGVVDFTLAPNDMTVYIGSATTGSYNYKIQGGIEIPANCLIEFDGGSISNGTLIGNETILVYDQEQEVVLKNVVLLGYFEESAGGGGVNKKDNVNGMATITLKKNKTFAEQLTQENTIYRIMYDFDLNSESVTVPANCVLEFDGGSLSNGTLVGQSTTINAPITKIFGENLVISRDTTSQGIYGTPSGWNNPYLYTEWFGAKGDGITDDIDAIQATIDSARLSKSGICCVKLMYNHIYAISDSIKIPSFTRFGGLTVAEDSYNGYFKPQVKQLSASTSLIVLYGSDYTENTNASRILINDLYLNGHGVNENASGIRVSNTVGSIEALTISDINLENNKIGISLSGAICQNTHLYNIYTTRNFTIGIGIYAAFSTGIWGLDIRDCYIAFTTIGGIYVEAPSMTGPLNMYNCYIESCGNEYSMDTLYAYGCYGLRLSIADKWGLVNIDGCYFESNCPTRDYGNGELHNDNPYGFIEAAGEDTGKGRYIYITNPNFKKTAEIVLEGKAVNLNITHSHFSVNYQTISLVNGGEVSFIDNKIFKPGRGVDAAFQDSIIKIFDSVNLCQDISVLLKQVSFAKSNISDNRISGITRALEFCDGTNPLNGCFDIDFTNIGENYKHFRTSANVLGMGNSPRLYVVGGAVGGYGLYDMPFGTLKDAFDHIKNYVGIKEIDIVVKGTITEIAHSSAISGIKYNIYSANEEEPATINFGGKTYTFNNSDVCFSNINFNINSVNVNVSAFNTNISYKNCSVIFNNNSIRGLCYSSGISKFVCEGCTITAASGVDVSTSKLNTKDGGIVYAKLIDCTNLENIPVTDDGALT